MYLTLDILALIKRCITCNNSFIGLKFTSMLLITVNLVYPAREINLLTASHYTRVAARFGSLFKDTVSIPGDRSRNPCLTYPEPLNRTTARRAVLSTPHRSASYCATARSAASHLSQSVTRQAARHAAAGRTGGWGPAASGAPAGVAGVARPVLVGRDDCGGAASLVGMGSVSPGGWAGVRGGSTLSSSSTRRTFRRAAPDPASSTPARSCARVSRCPPR